MGQSLDPRTKANIKAMLRVEAETGSGQSRLQWLNSPLPASKPCPAAMNRLLDRIEAIKDSGVLEADLTWLDDNYARALADRARASSVHRLRELSEPRQLATVACFLVECYRETLDQAVRLHSRLESVAAKDAREQRRERLQAFRKLERRALRAFRKMTAVLLDESVEDAQARQALFRQVPRAELSELDQGLEREKTAAAAAWDQAAELLELRAAKTRQFRQYAPRFLRALEFRAESPSGQPVLQALETLKDLYRQGNKGLPEEASEDFARRRDKPALASAPKKAKRQLWEAAVLSRLREKIESGDVFVAGSKRYGRLDDMLLPEEQWIQARDSFYERAGLPSNPSEAREFLGNRLNQAYDDFLAASGDGKAPGAARVDSQTGRCQTPRDPAVQLSSQERRQLEELKDWIGASLRPVKLPDLLIEADNALGFTRPLVPAWARNSREPGEVCVALAALMASGCNLGAHTMARMTAAASYERIRRARDWQLAPEALRESLGIVADAICSLEASQNWGRGESSSSDGQRFFMRGQALERTYSVKLGGFGLEFYSFIANNYAPFWSRPIECSERDAPYALDGLAHNESGLIDPREHYTDTHGYTEINFAAFALLGVRFCPRIKGLSKQQIYRADSNRDYGALAPRLKKAQRLDLDLIEANWDRLGRLWAAAARGRTTASTILKRLGSHSPANELYRACLHLGRLFKTEFILEYWASPELRTRIRRGINKTEQLHALNRSIFYGKQGTIDSGDFRRQERSCSCLTLLAACVIWWQINQIDKALREGRWRERGLEPKLLEHISPIEWSNVLLYGEYDLDSRRVQ
jgi:TnpA family transposase